MRVVGQPIAPRGGRDRPAALGQDVQRFDVLVGQVRSTTLTGLVDERRHGGEHRQQWGSLVVPVGPEHTEPAPLGAIGQRAQQPRLADAGRAAHDADPRGAIGREVEPPVHDAHFCRSVEERFVGHPRGEVVRGWHVLPIHRPSRTIIPKRRSMSCVDARCHVSRRLISPRAGGSRALVAVRT